MNKMYYIDKLWVFGLVLLVLVIVAIVLFKRVKKRTHILEDRMDAKDLDPDCPPLTHDDIVWMERMEHELSPKETVEQKMCNMEDEQDTMEERISEEYTQEVVDKANIAFEELKQSEHEVVEDKPGIDGESFKVKLEHDFAPHIENPVEPDIREYPLTPDESIAPQEPIALVVDESKQLTEEDKELFESLKESLEPESSEDEMRGLTEEDRQFINQYNSSV